MDRLRRFGQALVRGAAILVGVGAAALLLYKVLDKKRLQWTQTVARQKFLEESCRRRFVQAQIDNDLTLCGLFPAVLQFFERRIDVEALAAQLQQLRQTPSPSSAVERKDQLWAQVKIASFTRTLGAIYTLALLFCMIRIQHNILARRQYVASFKQSGKPESSIEPKDTPLKSVSQSDIDFVFMLVSSYLLNTGADHILARVQAAVEEAFGSVEITKSLSLADAVNALRQIRDSVENMDQNDAYEALKLCLLPRESNDELLVRAICLGNMTGPTMDAVRNEILPDPRFNELLNETRDYLESLDFTCFLKGCLDASFEQLRKTLHSAYRKAGAGGSQTDAFRTTMPLAHLCAYISKTLTTVFASNSNDYVNAMSNLLVTERFLGIVFTSFDVQQLVQL